jgi:hypothetical protein
VWSDFKIHVSNRCTFASQNLCEPLKEMNKTIQLQDLGNKDYKETWEYQEELFKGIVDLKIRGG